MNRRPNQAKVIYTETAKLYLKELIKILYQKDYFGYYESAREYVLSLRKDMETTIHIKQKYDVPFYFRRYGKNLYYVCYPKNKHTTWYFFFTYHPDSNIYFIRYITNNHVAGHLIGYR